jgi:hypothetical protein
MNIAKQFHFRIITGDEKEISSQEPQLGVVLFVFSIFLHPIAYFFDIPGHYSILTSTLIHSHCWLPWSLPFLSDTEFFLSLLCHITSFPIAYFI